MRKCLEWREHKYGEHHAGKFCADPADFDFSARTKPVRYISWSPAISHRTLAPGRTRLEIGLRDGNHIARLKGYIGRQVAILQELTPQESHLLPKPSAITISHSWASLPLMDVVDKQPSTQERPSCLCHFTAITSNTSMRHSLARPPQPRRCQCCATAFSQRLEVDAHD